MMNYNRQSRQHVTGAVILSCLSSPRTNQCLISVLRVAERPFALIFRLSDIFLSILQRMRKQCSVIDGRNLLVHAPSYPGDMRSNSCLRRLRVYISFLNSLPST